MGNTKPTFSKHHQLSNEDDEMGNTSNQPPDDWPPGKDETWKSQNSPLTWSFTEEQNKRKLKWLQFLVDSSPARMTAEKLVASLLMSEIIRQEWYANPELKRQPKVIDMHHLLHPDKAILTFQNPVHEYGMSGEDIKELHKNAFASTLASSNTKINDCTNSRQRSNHGLMRLGRWTARS